MNTKLSCRMESEKSFDEVADKIEIKAAEHKFRVLAVHDVQETLAEKGFERGPLKIIEVCNAGFAHQALALQPDVALFMPCRYAVHTENGKTVVRLSRPSLIAEMLPDPELAKLAADVEATLIKVMEESI